jgi:hypothetical protein
LSFLNSSSSPQPPRSGLYPSLKPLPIDVNNDNLRVYHDGTYKDFYHDGTYEDFKYNSPQSSVSSHGGNPMMRKDSTKFISPIVRKSGSSNSSTSLSNSSNPSSIVSSYHQSSIGSSKNHLQIHPEPLHRSSSSKPSSSSSSSNSSGSSHYPASSNSARSNNSWNPPSLQSRYTPYDDDGDDSVLWDDLSSLPVFGDDDIINPFDIKDGLITEMSKFNKKMNELYIFFKGKKKTKLKNHFKTRCTRYFKRYESTGL